MVVGCDLWGTAYEDDYNNSRLENGTSPESKCNEKFTPAASQILNKDVSGKSRKRTWNYRTAVGMLSYLQNQTRPDISMPVHQTARFCNDPKLSHEQAINRIWMTIPFHFSHWSKWTIISWFPDIRIRMDYQGFISWYLDIRISGGIFVFVISKLWSTLHHIPDFLISGNTEIVCATCNGWFFDRWRVVDVVAFPSLVRRSERKSDFEIDPGGCVERNISSK